MLLDNAMLGKITKEQRAGGVRRVADRLHNPDFAAYAELCGATGIAVDDPSQLDDGSASFSPWTAQPPSPFDATPN